MYNNIIIPHNIESPAHKSSVVQEGEVWFMYIQGCGGRYSYVARPSCVPILLIHEHLAVIAFHLISVVRIGAYTHIHSSVFSTKTKNKFILYPTKKNVYASNIHRVQMTRAFTFSVHTQTILLYKPQYDTGL